MELLRAVFPTKKKTTTNINSNGPTSKLHNEYFSTHQRKQKSHIYLYTLISDLKFTDLFFFCVLFSVFFYFDSNIVYVREFDKRIFSKNTFDAFVLNRVNKYIIRIFRIIIIFKYTEQNEIDGKNKHENEVKKKNKKKYCV